MQEDAMDPITDWRQTGRFLWVGARDGRHVGIIEQGRAYVAIDHEGAVKGRFKRLDLAQAALG
jgi:hypothetical protein